MSIFCNIFILKGFTTQTVSLVLLHNVVHTYTQNVSLQKRKKKQLVIANILAVQQVCDLHKMGNSVAQKTRKSRLTGMKSQYVYEGDIGAFEEAKKNLKLLHPIKLVSQYNLKTGKRTINNLIKPVEKCKHKIVAVCCNKTWQLDLVFSLV